MAKKIKNIKKSKSIKKESYSNYLLAIVAIIAIVGIVLMVNNGNCVSDDTDNTIEDENNLIGLAHGRNSDRNKQTTTPESQDANTGSITIPGSDDSTSTKTYIFIPKVDNTYPKIQQFGTRFRKKIQDTGCIIYNTESNKNYKPVEYFQDGNKCFEKKITCLEPFTEVTEEVGFSYDTCPLDDPPQCTTQVCTEEYDCFVYSESGEKCTFEVGFKLKGDGKNYGDICTEEEEDEIAMTSQTPEELCERLLEECKAVSCKVTVFNKKGCEEININVEECGKYKNCGCES